MFLCKSKKNSTKQMVLETPFKHLLRYLLAESSVCMHACISHLCYSHCITIYSQSLEKTHLECGKPLKNDILFLNLNPDNHGQKSWDKFTSVALFHTPQTNSHARIHLHLFSTPPPPPIFQTDNSAFLRNTENLCIYTGIPRTFVQDCS